MTGVAAVSGTLKDRQLAMTRQLILDAAVEQLESGDLTVTMRSVANRANIAERTVFRHFAAREDLLDALAVDVTARFELPPLPATAAELPGAVRGLYRAFEEHSNLTQAALHSELFDRIRVTAAGERWRGVRALIDAFAPHRSDRERMLIAANIRYLLAATSWHYYRYYFGFSLKDSTAAAESAIRLAVDSLRGDP